MTQTPLTLRRWERDEYERLVQLGIFRGEPIELIGGQLIVAEPQAAHHAGAITKVDYALRAILPSGRIVRLQAPVALDPESEPAPDLVVVRGHPGDYLQAHPGRPVLAAEVPESSLEFARKQKGSLYARAGDRGLLDREPRRSRPGGVPRALARYLHDVWVAVPIRHRADAPIRCRALGLPVESDRRRRPPALAGAARPSFTRRGRDRTRDAHRGPGDHSRLQGLRGTRYTYRADEHHTMKAWHWTDTSMGLDATLYWYARPGGTDDFPHGPP